MNQKLQFHPLTLSQIPLLKEYFQKNTTRLCDHTLGGAMMWRNGFDTHFALEEGILYLQSSLPEGGVGYAVPMGDPVRGISRLMEGLSEGEVLTLFSVSEEEKEELLARFPKAVAIPTRDWFDYLYLAQNLRTFAGKKLSGQRNHRNFFLKNHADWRFEPISSENLEEVRAFFGFYNETVQKDSEFFKSEKEAVLEVLEHREEYGFLGGLIRAEGEVVAISFAEILHDTLFVHIEKAARQVRGSYQMITSEMIAHYATPEVLYVNREEDVGDPGLRYSKEAYHPERLLEKYRIHIKKEA